MLLAYFRKLITPRLKRPIQKTRVVRRTLHRSALQLETLEDRTLPSAASFLSAMHSLTGMAQSVEKTISPAVANHPLLATANSTAQHWIEKHEVTINKAPTQSPEGTTVNLSSSLNGPFLANPQKNSYSWTVTDNGSQVASGNQDTFSFTPQQAGTYDVNLTVTTWMGFKRSTEQTIIVTALPPSAAINGVPTNNPEGTPISLSSSVNGPTSYDQTAGYTYAWAVTQNGSQVASSDQSTLTFTPQQAGTYTVSLTTTDVEGQSATTTQSLTVAAVPPTVTITNAPSTSPVGTAINLSSTVTGPTATEEAAGYTYAWTVTQDGNQVASGSQDTFTFTPQQLGSFTVSLTVTDSEGQSATASESVTVFDVPPSNLSLNLASASLNEGQTASLSGSFSDTNSQASYIVDVNWGDGSGDSTFSLSAGTTSFSGITHPYQDNPTGQPNGSYTISVTVTDNFNGSDSTTTNVTVKNVAPTVAIQNNPSQVLVGTSVTLNSSVVDASPTDQAAGFTYSWTVTENGNTVATGNEATLSFTPTDSATYNIVLTVTDKDGGVGSDSTTLVSGMDPLDKTVLNQSNFTYEGSFVMPYSANGWSTAASEGGLAFRYVDGQLHFFSTNNVNSGGLVFETNFPGLGTGSTLPVAKVVQNWGNVYGNDKWYGTYGSTGTSSITATDTYGLYYDQASNRLYWSYANGYNTTNPYSPSFGYSTLDDQTGVATAGGAWSLSGRTEKMDRGGITPIPQWFANAYTGGDTLGVGFGGSFSVESDPVSMGPALAAIAPPDPLTDPNRSALPNVPLLGYPWTSGPQSWGQRDPNYVSYYENGVYPTKPASAQYQASNGVGVWTESDVIYQGGTWIDTPTGGGLLFIAKVGQGNVYYQNSDRHTQGGAYEWFVYNPADLAKVASGQLKQNQIQPEYIWTTPTLPLNPQDVNGWAGDGASQIGGVTYDPTSGQLFVLENSAYHPAGQVEWYPEVFVYKVS